MVVTVDNVAPVITNLIGPSDPLGVGTQVSLTASFSDPGSEDTHTAIWSWGDGSTNSETINGHTVQGSHTYTSAGVYTVSLVVNDKDGGEGRADYRYVVVYDPSGGFVTGGGWINSPTGAYLNDPSLTGKATFGFVSRYLKGANILTGNTQFVFHAADFVFQSSAYEWLVISGTKAQFKGSGTINGEGSYQFLLSAFDASPDHMRIKIWDTETEEVIYDNKRGDGDSSDAATELGGGSITIHKN
jgi:PKD repeat protein